MKIINVRAHVLEARLSQPFALFRRVVLYSDWGECYGPARIKLCPHRERSPGVL
jgi:hypothetical protein